MRRMLGLPDYVVRVGTPDLDTFEVFVTAGLGAVPGIAKIDSHRTMKVVKSPDRPAASAAGRSVRRARWSAPSTLTTQSRELPSWAR